MDEIREIGIEKEVFLVDYQFNIKEPKLYGFPRDEFEFLVELRSLPSDRLYPILTTLQQEELQYKLRANKFGMELYETPYMLREKKWIDKHWDKYNLHRFNELDSTKNIYDEDKPSHHMGVLDTENKKMKLLTAGIHVHFSSRDSDTGEVIDLPIEDIVHKMDSYFMDDILQFKRIAGEWEPKTHGFEYRSLPCNLNVYEVLKEAFKILRSV